MKTDLNTTGTYSQRRIQGLKERLAKGGPLPLDAKDPKALSPDYKLDLTSKSPVTKVATESTSLSTPSSPSIELLSTKTPEIKPQVEDLAKSKAQKEVASEVKAEVTKKVEAKAGSVKKPAVIFIKGLDLFSSPSRSERGYAGVGKLAEAVEGASVYGWNQKQDIIDEVLKVHKDFPVVLVGHSLGGDTAHEVAEELDSLEHKFKTVDLLITIDAVGFDNDIISQNVKKHLNIFGENSFFLNDDPHVARRNDLTEVKNILSPLDHTDIDDDKSIQYEVLNLIQQTLSRTV